MKAYKITGKFLMGSQWMNFTKEIATNSVEEAKEKIFSEIGSNHKTKRKNISIEDVKQIKISEVENIYIREMLEAENG